MIKAILKTVFLCPLALVIATQEVCVGPSVSKAPKVLVTIKPLYELTKTIMKGVTEPTLLLDGTDDPHHFAMRPSHAQSLKDADFVIWVGPTLEPFLIKPLATLNKQKLTLMGIENLTLLERSHTDSGMIKETCHNCRNPQQAQTSLDDINASFVKSLMKSDPHIWLSVDNTILIVKEIAYHLSAMDLLNAPIYQHNAKALTDALITFKTELNTITKPLQNLSFIAFHDGYAYLEHDYGLHNCSANMSLHGHTLGLKTMTELSQVIQADKITCMLVDPQHTSPLEQKIAKDHNMAIIKADPLGLTIPGGDNHYIVLMRTLLQSLLTCVPMDHKNTTDSHDSSMKVSPL